jgi:hypothetical protein
MATCFYHITVILRTIIDIEIYTYQKLYKITIICFNVSTFYTKAVHTLWLWNLDIKSTRYKQLRSTRIWKTY